MIALVFFTLKHSLQWRGEFHLDFGSVPEFLLVNSSAKRFFFLMAAGFEGKLLSSFLYLPMCSLTIFGSVGIWADNLCPARQWKCWKSDIRSSVFNKYIYLAFSARRKSPRAGKSRKAHWQIFPTWSITLLQNEDPNLLSREKKSALVLQTFRFNFLWTKTRESLS